MELLKHQWNLTSCNSGMRTVLKKINGSLKNCNTATRVLKYLTFLFWYCTRLFFYFEKHTIFNFFCCIWSQCSYKVCCNMKKCSWYTFPSFFQCIIFFDFRIRLAQIVVIWKWILAVPEAPRRQKNFIFATGI